MTTNMAIAKVVDQGSVMLYLGSRSVGVNGWIVLGGYSSPNPLAESFVTDGVARFTAGAFDTVDAAMAANVLVLAGLTDIRTAGFFLGDRTLGTNGWLFFGGY